MKHRDLYGRLRHHPGEVLHVPKESFARIARALKLRRAVWPTILGKHEAEFREDVPRNSIHVRIFPHHIELHSDRWNPDWNFDHWLKHLILETPFLMLVGGALFAGAVTQQALIRFIKNVMADRRLASREREDLIELAESIVAGTRKRRKRRGRG